MASERTKKDWPRTVRFGAGRVRISKRTNGSYALAWREMGADRQTTKSTEAKALEWAVVKAQHLDAGRQRQWVDAGEAEMLEALRRLAGGETGKIRGLLEDVRGALKWLEGGADLTAAARWYAENGPLRVTTVTVREAVGRFLAEYARRPAATRATFGTELKGFLASGPLRCKGAGGGGGDLLLQDLTAERLERWVQRKVERGGRMVDPAPRTLRGRITTWITFLNRARDWRLLGPGKHAAALLRRPVIPDAGKEILSVEQGRKLLAAVREHAPKLEAYLLIAGWLGLRPSEVQRLTWGAVEWDRGYLHVSAAVAGKTSSERYVPIDERVLARLREIWQRGGRGGAEARGADKVSGFRSREFLSLLARRHGVLEVWPTDVLRHSFCSYRIALVQSFEQVAVEAGNSPSILKSHYRRPLRAEDGADWWGVLDG